MCASALAQQYSPAPSPHVYYFNTFIPLFIYLFIYLFDVILTVHRR